MVVSATLVYHTSASTSEIYTDFEAVDLEATSFITQVDFRRRQCCFRGLTWHHLLSLMSAYMTPNHRRGVGPSSSHETFFSSHCSQSSLEKPLEMPPSTTPYGEVSIMFTTQRVSVILTLKRTVGVTCTPVKRLALVRSLISFVTLLPLFRLPSSPGLSEISRRL
jgi:hypothetical protein